MFGQSAFDALPVEIVLLMVDNLDLKSLLSLLRWIRWLPDHLTSRQLITIRDKRENTILHLLAESGEAALMEPLLSKVNNVSPDPRNRSGQTPLSCAAKNGHKAAVELLLNVKNGVHPDSQDYFGRTPLLWAAMNGHKEIVQLLLREDGVNPDAGDRRGWTALLWAAACRHLEIVEILLRARCMGPCQYIHGMDYKSTTAKVRQSKKIGGQTVPPLMGCGSPHLIDGRSVANIKRRWEGFGVLEHV
jgi:ankyrin repeat protein